MVGSASTMCVTRHARGGGGLHALLPRVSTLVRFSVFQLASIFDEFGITKVTNVMASPK